MARIRHFPGFWPAVLLCLGVLAFQVALTVPFAVAGVVLKSPIAESAWVACGVNLVAFGLVVVIGTVLARSPFRAVVPVRRLAPGLLAPILLTVLGGVILLSEADNVFRAVLPMPRVVEAIFRQFTSTPAQAAGFFVLLVIVAPVTEEALFRGVILQGLLSRYRTPAAVALSALLFAFTHVNPWQMVSATALGVLFAWWRIRTGSVTPGWLGHVLANAFVFAMPHLPLKIRGFNAEGSLHTFELQPLGFNALGLGLVLLGCWLFRWMTPVRPAPPRLEDRAETGDRAAAEGAPIPPRLDG